MSGASSSSAAQPAGASEQRQVAHTIVAASASSAAQPASESEQLSAFDAPSPRACTEESPQLRFAEDLAAAATAGRAALQTIDWSTTEGAAIRAAISAGRGARAEGSTDEEAIAAAHEASKAKSCAQNHPVITFEILYKAMPKKRPKDPPTRTPLTGPATATESSVPAVLSKAMPHDLLTKKLRANMVPPSSSTATSASSAKVPSAKVEYAINLSDSD